MSQFLKVMAWKRSRTKLQITQSCENQQQHKAYKKDFNDRIGNGRDNMVGSIFVISVLLQWFA